MPNSPQTDAATSADERVLSIDALRGFDMFWIIGGHAVVWSILEIFHDPIPETIKYHMSHPAWIGFSARDMIMPLFLFIVGAAMPFSLAKRWERGDSTTRIYTKILGRSVVLFILGMAAQGNLLDLDHTTFHFFSNTLQAIAVGYLFGSILLLHLPVVGQIVATAGLLIGFWALMMFVPFGDAAGGTLEPQQNLAIHIDRTVFGEYDDGNTYTWLLSGLGFTATVMLGAFAGQLLRLRCLAVLKVLGLIALGGACLAAGYAWSFHFPIIKHLWTSSMVLWAGGWSFLLLALFYLVIDVIGLKGWAFPFIVIGANAIAVYMTVQVVNVHHITGPIVGGLAKHVGPYGDPLLNISRLAFLWLILWYMYRNKTFIRV